MATITVVQPKIVTPGLLSHFENWQEHASIATTARSLVISDGAGKWTTMVADPTITVSAVLLGQVQNAASNKASGMPYSDILILTPGTVVELNSNASGTDPVKGLAYATIMSGTYIATVDQADNTNVMWTVRSLASGATSGDTNVAVWATPVSVCLYFGGSLGS